MNTQIADTLSGRVPGFSKGWAVVLIILGLLSLLLPYEAGVAIAIAVSILVIVAGIVHLAGTFAARTTGGFFWRLLVGGAYLVAGVYLLMHPKLSLISITLFLAILLLVEGVSHLATYFHLRSAPGSGWLLFDSLVTILLAFLIWRSWPVSAVWALGTLFGVNLVMSGFSRLMYSSASGRDV